MITYRYDIRRCLARDAPLMSEEHLREAALRLGARFMAVMVQAGGITGIKFEDFCERTYSNKVSVTPDLTHLLESMTYLPVQNVSLYDKDNKMISISADVSCDSGKLEGIVGVSGNQEVLDRYGVLKMYPQID